MGRKLLKKNITGQIEIVPIDESKALESQRKSDDHLPKREKWMNKQRVLVHAARGINHRDRHLMKDIKILFPHHRPDSKMERAKTLSVINEMCAMKHCNKSILFEGRRKCDLYIWTSNVPQGPSAKFLIENIHTMAELKMTGNCLRGSRPLLSFDSKFDNIPYLKLFKELLTQTFSVPHHHPKSQPFFDHVYTFTFLDNRIWFRNFQILSEDGALAEIGPRFVFNPVKVFDGSYTGNVIWENPDYVSPSRQRQLLKKIAKEKYVNRIEQKVHQEASRPRNAYVGIEHDEMFDDESPVVIAKKIAENVSKKPLNSAKDKKLKTQKGLEQKRMKEKLTIVSKIIEKKKFKAKITKL